MEGEEEEEEEEEDDEDDASVILVRDSRSSGLKPPAVDTTLYGFWPSTVVVALSRKKINLEVSKIWFYQSLAREDIC